MKTRKLLSLVLAMIMLLGCMTVTAFADGTSAYLDLESTATYADKKDIDQNYTFTQASEEYTDVTKVKLDWTINDIAATFKSHKTWDADKLTWVEAKEDIAVTNEGASFTLTNYSSKNVIAKAEFKVEDALKNTFDKATFENNECIVATPVVKDTTTTYTDASFTALKQTITATLTLKKDAFANLSATTSATKYGTYTITLAEKKDATITAPTTKTTGLTYSNSEQELVNAGITDGGTWQYKLGDGEYSTTVPKAKDAGTYTVYYKLVGDNTYNDIAEASVQVTIAKATQSISAPTKASATSTSVTLNAIGAGQGATKYGYSSSANSQPTSWQDSTSFTTGLTEDTTYYFFAKYEGNSNYNEVISTGTGIKTNSASYAINTLSLTNITANGNNPTTINSEGNTTLKFTATDGYALPDSVNIANATLVSWNKSTGELILSNATGAVDITITGRVLSTYNITTSLTNINAVEGNPTTIKENATDITLTFIANDGYVLPGDVSVTNATYSWDGSTGILTLSKPTGDVSITISGEYTITYSLTGVTADSGYVEKISPNATNHVIGFGLTGSDVLPDSVTVTGATYNWNSSTGTLTLTNITGNVSITVTAVKVYNISAMIMNEGAVVAHTDNPTTIKQGGSVTLVYYCIGEYKFTDDSIINVPNVTYELSISEGGQTATLTISNPTGDVAFQINAYQN